MNVLRGLVIGEAQTSTQRAAELCAFINGIPLDAPPGFVPQTHPLLLQHHDIPAFMGAMESKFKCLRALDVADEYKIHADLFLKTIMMFIGPFINSLTERYHRKLGTSQPLDLMELKGLLQTYETSRYLDRSKSTAFMAASLVKEMPPDKKIRIQMDTAFFFYNNKKTTSGVYDGGVYPPAVAWAVRPGRCWLRARCRCAALLVLVLMSALVMPKCGA
jgi:hypothetical protein